MNESPETTMSRRRPERRFAGDQSLPSPLPGPGALATSAPIVLPEHARPQLTPSPSRSELEEIGRQTASVAHDFNNLLSVIMVCAGEIASAPSDGPHRERAMEIREAAEQGAALSRGLLADSEGGRVNRTGGGLPARTDLEPTIAGSLKLIERTLGPAIRLSFHSDGHLPSVPLAPGEIERILLNLAANSRDAMPAGGLAEVRLCVVSVPAADPILGTGWHVRVTFADNGTGMDREVARRAVEPYFSTKDHRDGTGLGLASARALVRSAGGDLRINSRPHAGTTISIYLPGLDASGELLALPPPLSAGP